MNQLEQYKQYQLNLAMEYRNGSKAKNSITTYEFAWKKYTKWCEEHQYNYLNPISSSYELLIALFISSMASSRSLKSASIDCYVAGIKHFYTEKGIEVDIHHKELRKVRSGIKRELGTAQVQKMPLMTETIKLLVDVLDQEKKPMNMRDKAIILTGFAGAFRRSEIVGIDVEHIDFNEFGMSILLPKSKCDQEGKGRIIDIPFTTTEKYCPVRALKSWMTHANIKTGPIFLSIHKTGVVKKQRLTPYMIAKILKKHCEPFGISDQVAGHSLRAGHVTSSIKAGTPESWIMRQTGHKSLVMLRRYERLKREFEANSVARIGL